MRRVSRLSPTPSGRREAIHLQSVNLVGMHSATWDFLPRGRLPCPDHPSFALKKTATKQKTRLLVPWPFQYFDGQLRSDLKPVFPEVTCRPAGRPGGGGWGERHLLRSNAIYQRVFSFPVGFWSGLVKDFCKVETREPHAPQSRRNVWQEPFHKNRKRNPSRVLLSLLLLCRRTVS